VKTILVDDRRLKQSLVNLLGNAVKFTPQGGTIGLEVNGHPELSEVTFTIWDTGVGIASEDIQYLFKPFVQLDAGLAREFQGTGLGLALVAQMIHLHGGRVHVESTLGQGSRFIITLSWWSEQQNAPLTRATGEIPRVRLTDGRKLSGKILLVEDTNVVITLMSEYLIYKGYKVYIAGNGLEGVQIAKEEHPDLILMDVMMPVMDGLEATRRIRADQSLRDVPIIALTALAMADDREHCLAAGMNDYMSKPIKMQELSDVIEKYLGAGSASGGKKSSVDNESHVQ
jgi:CheY-like chemotaxis protein